MPTLSRLPVSSISFFLLISTCSPSASADEFSVVSHPSKLHLPLGQTVDSSPGARPGSIMTCNRVHIHGLSRLRHLSKFAHALKVRLNVSQGDAIFRIQTIELCFHRNASLGVGMCPSEKWQKLSKGYWVQNFSPFENRIVDIRTLPDPSRLIELSTEYEFLLHRLIFLVVGMVMMAVARVVSQSVVFYYGSAMAVGIILVILMVLFQGMKLLPTGRRNSLAIFMYSSLVGVATFLLRYLSGLLHSILVELGISEDMHNPLGIFLFMCLVLAGAWFGYWGVRKLVLTEDGIVDSSVASFMEWTILIFAAVMILLSSLDPLLAVEALCSAIIVLTLSRTRQKARFLRRVFKKTIKGLTGLLDQISPNRNSHDYGSPPRAKHIEPPQCGSPILGLIKTSPRARRADIKQADFYSTFHDTPEKAWLSKEELASVTREQTSTSLTELISSPEFTQWALSNAERIMVTPHKNARFEKLPRRLLRWF